MSNSIRFLGAAIFAWAAVRAVSLGLVPGMNALAFDAEAAQSAKPRLPPIQPKPLPPIEGFAPLPEHYQASYQGSNHPAFVPYPVYISVPAQIGSPPPRIVYLDRPTMLPAEINVYGGSSPFVAASPPAPVSAIQAALPERQAMPFFAELKAPKLPDRLTVSSWAMMRNRAGSDSLAGAGMLGGSQAGARLLWRLDPHLSASFRASAPINSQRGVEAAAGIRYQPSTSLPIAITLERRHAFRDYGQSAFALFAEGGTYGRRMPWNSTLDAYFQGGVVDFNHPDWFVDGQAALTRPLWRNLSAGAGVWGGAQPGITRLDFGPRATLRVGQKMRIHLDYRYKAFGNAVPGTGGVVTLAGDF